MQHERIRKPAFPYAVGFAVSAMILLGTVSQQANLGRELRAQSNQSGADIPLWATEAVTGIVTRWSTGALSEARATEEIRDVIVRVATGQEPPQDPQEGCIDTDPGNDPNRRGVVTVTAANGEQTVYADTCPTANNSIIHQWKCAADETAQRVPTEAKDMCSFGCSDGACHKNLFAAGQCGNSILEKNVFGGYTEYCDRGAENGITCRTNASQPTCQYCSETCTLKTARLAECGQPVPPDTGEPPLPEFTPSPLLFSSSPPDAFISEWEPSYTNLTVFDRLNWPEEEPRFKRKNERLMQEEMQKAMQDSEEITLCNPEETLSVQVVQLSKFPNINAGAEVVVNTGHCTALLLYAETAGGDINGMKWLVRTEGDSAISGIVVNGNSSVQKFPEERLHAQSCDGPSTGFGSYGLCRRSPVWKKAITVLGIAEDTPITLTPARQIANSRGFVVGNADASLEKPYWPILPLQMVQPANLIMPPSAGRSHGVFESLGAMSWDYTQYTGHDSQSPCEWPRTCYIPPPKHIEGWLIRTLPDGKKAYVKLPDGMQGLAGMRYDTQRNRLYGMLWGYGKPVTLAAFDANTLTLIGKSVPIHSGWGYPQSGPIPPTSSAVKPDLSFVSIDDRFVFLENANGFRAQWDVTAFDPYDITSPPSKRKIVGEDVLPRRSGRNMTSYYSTMVRVDTKWVLLVVRSDALPSRPNGNQEHQAGFAILSSIGEIEGKGLIGGLVSGTSSSGVPMFQTYRSRAGKQILKITPYATHTSDFYLLTPQPQRIVTGIPVDGGVVYPQKDIFEGAHIVNGRDTGEIVTVHLATGEIEIRDVGMCML